MTTGTTRRKFLLGTGAAALSAAVVPWAGVWSAGRDLSPKEIAADRNRALVSITLDLEMSRNFPKWEMMEWDYEKGNLDDATKQYTVGACQRVKRMGGVIHCFAVGRTLEQPDVEWLKGIAAEGHPIGNHTYDHIYLLAKKAEDVQFRFKRSPWLIEGKGVPQVIEENVRLATKALQERAGIKNNGFRTPGGFATGLTGRDDLQQMLLNCGFTWVSSKYPTHPITKPFEEPNGEFLEAIVKAQSAAQAFHYPTGLIELPMSPISDVGAFRNCRWKLESFLTAIRKGVEWAIANKATYDFLAHPSCLGVADPEFKTIDMICELVQKAGDRASLVGLDVFAERAKLRRQG
ncbi:MAG: polysaccharide deacetylase family protein [Planctomycetales bacterium]